MSINEWIRKAENNNPIVIIYFDYEKAFSKVPYKKLLLKVELQSRRQNLLEWIDAYIYGKNKWKYNVLRGVPHGTVLGPLLFVA